MNFTCINDPFLPTRPIFRTDSDKNLSPYSIMKSSNELNAK